MEGFKKNLKTDLFMKLEGVVMNEMPWQQTTKNPHENQTQTEGGVQVGVQSRVLQRKSIAFSFRSFYQFLFFFRPFSLSVTLPCLSMLNRTSNCWLLLNM
jgi:hypothetical protein